jgi:hypothetical protein
MATAMRAWHLAHVRSVRRSKARPENTFRSPHSKHCPAKLDGNVSNGLHPCRADTHAHYKTESTHRQHSNIIIIIIIVIIVIIIVITITITITIYYYYYYYYSLLLFIIIHALLRAGWSGSQASLLVLCGIGGEGYVGFEEAQ